MEGKLGRSLRRTVVDADIRKNDDGLYNVVVKRDNGTDTPSLQTGSAATLNGGLEALVKLVNPDAKTVKVSDVQTRERKLKRGDGDITIAIAKLAINGQERVVFDRGLNANHALARAVTRRSR